MTPVNREFFLILAAGRAYVVHRVTENKFILLFKNKEIHLTSYLSAFMALDLLITEELGQKTYLN